MPPQVILNQRLRGRWTAKARASATIAAMRPILSRPVKPADVVVSRNRLIGPRPVFALRLVLMLRGWPDRNAGTLGVAPTTSSLTVEPVLMSMWLSLIHI